MLNQYEEFITFYVGNIMKYVVMFKSCLPVFCFFGNHFFCLKIEVLIFSSTHNSLNSILLFQILDWVMKIQHSLDQIFFSWKKIGSKCK